MIDTVEQFDYNSLNDDYNSAYHSWRKTGPSSFCFRYQKKKEEKMSADLGSKLPPNEKDTERNVMRNAIHILGIALILMLLAESLGSRLFVWIFNSAGIPTQTDFLTYSTYGSQWSVILVKILSETLKYLVPALFLSFQLKYPKKMFTSLKCHSWQEQFGTVGLGLAVGVLIYFAENLSNTYILDIRNIYNLKGNQALICYAVYELVLGSVLAEWLLRGILLPLLRQYSDLFAVLLTAFIGLLCPNNLPYRLGEFLLGIACGFIFLRCGSLLYAYMIRFSYSLFLIGKMISDANERSFSDSAFLLTVSIISCIFILIWIIFRKKKYHIKNNSHFLKAYEQLEMILFTPSMLAWIGISLILAVIQLCL